MKETWFTVFCNSATHHWWNIFLKDGFEHCFMFTVHDGTWISVEVLLWRTEIRLIPHHVYEDHGVRGMSEFFLHDLDNTIVKYEGGPVFSSVPRLLPLTCVSVVESILGIKGHSWTPYRLYKRLMKDDMSSLFSKPKIPVQDNTAQIEEANKRERAATAEKRKLQEQALATQKSKQLTAASLLSIDEDEDGASPFLGIPTKTSLA